MRRLQNLFRRRSRSSARTRPCGKRLGFERLEGRDLLAGNVFAAFGSGSLILRGDNAANEIRIGVTGGNLVVEGQNGTTVNRQATPFLAVTGGNTIPRSVIANLLGGDDSIFVDGVNVSSVARINTQGGNDTIRVGGNSQFTRGLAIDGGPNDDTIIVENNTSGINGTVAIRGHTGDDTIVLQNNVLNGIVSLFAQQGNDEVAVFGNTFSRNFGADGGRGTDTYGEGAGSNTFNARSSMRRFTTVDTAVTASLGQFLAGQTDASALSFVTVGDTGNAGELSGASAPGGLGPDATVGAVNYVYRISTFEVTNAQYTEFLNAVAKTDANNLYNTSMSGSSSGGIDRTGSTGSFTYMVQAGEGNRPVNFVSFYDALRYANWLHNGKPTGAQGPTTTEGGAYTFTAKTTLAAGTDPNHGANGRNAGAKFWLPSEDEWYKAAYFNPTTSTYFDYAIRSDTTPTAEVPVGGNNSANYLFVVGNVTDVGAYTSSPSPYGTFDQNGNVFEWNEAMVTAFSRGLRGGSFDGGSAYNLQAAARSLGGFPSDGGDLNGFRIASLPEP